MPNKCLVKKLEAVVDNPDLPVFEPILQFTLDVIQASGNSQMTDKQKKALNHFFYQIGVDKNDGIFSKAIQLFIPLICNQNLEKALYDYKSGNNRSASLKKTTFSGNGLICDGTGAYGTYTLGAITEMTNNFHYAIGFTTTPVTNNIMKITDGGTFIGVKTSGSDYIKPIFRGVEMPSLIEKTKPAYSFVFNVGNQSVKAMTSSDDTIYDSDYSFGSDVVANNIMYYFDNTPQAVMMIGSSLTNAEHETLARAIEELCRDYNAVS